MKNIISFLFCLLVSCSLPNKLLIKLTKYTPPASFRDQLGLSLYQLNANNLSFIKSLNLDSAFAFKRTFSDFQSLYNSWKKKEIDSISYNYQINVLKELDSAAKNEMGYTKLVNDAIIYDTTIDPEVKMLFGINKAKNEITIIVDENNNNFFGDDRIVKITPLNYTSIFDTLHFEVKNLEAPIEKTIKKFSLFIDINSLGGENKQNNFSNLMKLPIPWISANSYYSGMKKNGNQKIYFDFNVFLYNIGYTLNQVIISKSPITRNNLNINDTIYSGDYFKLKNKVYHIDSISDKKQLAYISLNKTNINSVLGKSKSNIFNPIKKDSLLCITGIQTNLAEVFANNADSLFLIDIWASWCEPCRKEMPISKALSKKYIGSKIKFIYLSVDNNKDSWEKACNEEDLINSNSFLLTNSWNSNFIKKNNIFSIPRYILIGRNGRVISIDAPELNDSKLRKLIDNSLLD